MTHSQSQCYLRMFVDEGQGLPERQDGQCLLVFGLQIMLSARHQVEEGRNND